MEQEKDGTERCWSSKLHHWSPEIRIHRMTMILQQAKAINERFTAEVLSQNTTSEVKRFGRSNENKSFVAHEHSTAKELYKIVDAFSMRCFSKAVEPSKWSVMVLAEFHPAST